MSRKLMPDWKLFFLSFSLVSLSAFAEPVINFSEQAENMRDQVLTEIHDIFPKISTDKKAELYFRLGETYQAKANYAYATENLQFDVDYQKWFDCSSKGV